MPQGLTADEANALRTRIAEAIKDEPRRSPKRVAVRLAFGNSNFSSFMRGERGASPAGRARVLAVLDRGERAKVGRPVYQRVTPEEGKALRTEVMKHATEKYGSLGAFFTKAMRYPSRSQSHLYGVIQHGKALTTETAAKLRAALDGQPVRLPVPRMRTTSTAMVKSTEVGREFQEARTRAPRAPRNVLANLRLDAGNALSSRFGGSVAALARELGMTAHRLSKFLDGGPLTLDESADVANRSSPLARTESVSPAPGLTMLRAVAGGMSVEAWRHGGTGGAGEIEPPELRARKLVEKWGTEAIAMVLQLAGGAA